MKPSVSTLTALTAALFAGALAASVFAQKAPPDPNSINLNSSRSNIYREAAPQPVTAPTAAPANHKVGTQPPPLPPANATTVKGSKSNGSE